MIGGILLAAGLGISVLYDLREHRIPNWVTVPGLGAGLVLQAAQGGPGGFAAALSGAAVAAALLALPFALGWMGGGGLKLLAAAGALMGAPFAFWSLAFALALGGVMALGRLARSGGLTPSLQYVFLVWLPGPRAKPEALATSFSFGPALALGVLAAWFWP